MSSAAPATRSDLARHDGAPSTGMADRYFRVMSLILLAVVLIGFSRTFFLRPIFKVPAVPWYVYVHGAVMTAWIVLLATQTSLIAARRTDLHRRLGIGGAFLAVAVAVSALLLTLTIPSLFQNGSPSPNGQPLPFAVAYPIMWGNFGSVLLFTTMVPTALWMRRRPQVHKRLMLLASFTIVGPAIGRMYGFPELWGITTSAPLITAIFHALPAVSALGLPLTLVAHDLLTMHRLHRATLWGVGVTLAIGAGFTVGISGTAVGHAVWNALL
jgi:hypothetical protein